MIITIDGPAASGKSSTARAVARRLGFRRLESGAFYRAITYAALRSGPPPEAWPRLTPEQVDGLGLRFRPADRGYRFRIDDEDITDRLRTGEVDAHVSRMARVRAVRDWLMDRLRQAAAGTDLVADGRDMGTVVFPDADLKIFLTAEPEERARRRLRDRGITEPTREPLAAEVRRLRERDRMDSERQVAPLRRAEDAVVVDTTHLTFDEQVARIVALAEARRHTDAGDG